MRTNLLFPHSFKQVGWILLIPTTILGIMVVFFDYECSFLNCKVFALYGDSNIFAQESGFCHIIKDNLTNELTGILFLIAAAFVAFSQEKIEDEWATYMSCAFLLACFIFVYGSPFLTIIVLSPYLLLMVFIVRFNILLYRLKHNGDEK